MRVFIGIALPPAVRSLLARLQQQLAESQADVKWVEEPNLHVTMRFLGEIDAAQRQAIERMLGRIASATPMVGLGLSHLGAFPSVESPRVVWVGVGEGQQELEALAQALERELSAIGLPGEERAFVAHVTLGRVRSARHLSHLSQMLGAAVWQPPAPWKAASLTLYQSALTSGGPRYTVLSNAMFS